MQPRPNPAEARASNRWHPVQPIPDGALTGTYQAAALTAGVSVETLRRRAKAGQLRTIRMGGRVLVDVASLRALIGQAA